MRRYGRWAGCPDGVKENPHQCVVSVSGGLGWAQHQCYRSRGCGPDKLYCAQHAKQIAAGKTLWVPEDEGAEKATGATP